MKYDDLENIWTVDIHLLSNSDRGRVYFERAKRVIYETFSDPVECERAIRGRRFKRSYLIKKIGCQRAVTAQNPKIRQLLIETDKEVCMLLDNSNE